MAYAVATEGLYLHERREFDVEMERIGHEIRAEFDPDYKRATWGRRPEDIAAQRAVVAELAGKRQR